MHPSKALSALSGGWINKTNMTVEEKLLNGESVEFTPDKEELEKPEGEESNKETQPEEKLEAKTPEESSSLKSKPWKDYVRERQEWRKERDEMKSQMDEIKARYEQQDSKESQMELDAEIHQLAEQYKASPDVIKGILDISAKRTPRVDESITSEIAQYREKAAFDSEWDGLLDDVIEIYPNASYTQLIRAKKLMDDLSHSEDYSLEGKGQNVPLSEILEMEEESFDEILASAKSNKSFESRGRQSPEREEPSARKKPDFESMSFDEIRKWEEDRDNESSRLERESQGKDYDEVSRRF